MSSRDAKKAADALEAKDKEIERLTADCEMKDKRIDWTVSDNVKKALEIERLRAALQDIVDCVTHYYSRRDIQATALAALEGDDG
jgi:hypothetical protein